MPEDTLAGLLSDAVSLMVNSSPREQANVRFAARVVPGLNESVDGVASVCTRTLGDSEVTMHYARSGDALHVGVAPRSTVESWIEAVSDTTVAPQRAALSRVVKTLQGIVLVLDRKRLARIVRSSEQVA